MICRVQNNSSREHVDAWFPALNTKSKRLDCMPAKITGPEDPRVQANTGKKFNKLTAVKYLRTGSERGKTTGQIWEFLCDCGTRKELPFTVVKNGLTVSCGCFKKIVRVTHGFTRGYQRKRLYGVWATMIQRCKNPNVKEYRNYGGRGITVCESWRDFRNFLSDMEPGYAPGLTIERKDNNGNYCAENCTWKTRLEQARNRRPRSCGKL